MAKLSVIEIAKAIGGVLSGEGWRNPICSYSIDSRTIEPEDLFFAIEGKNYDGHQFLSEAFKKGASGAVVKEGVPIPSNNSEGRLIKVKDTHQALKDLASYIRAHSSLKVIGITGSCGKTSVKDMTYQLLKDHFTIKRTEGNYNNLYGLPLSLLRVEDDDEVFVGEMAMSAPGEIAELAKIAQPTIGVITNIHPVHTEFFDSMQNVAKAKKEILGGLVGDRMAVLNADNALVQEIAQDFDGIRITFGIEEDADIRAMEISNVGIEGMSFQLSYGDQFYPVTLNIIGKYNIYNLLAALGACQALGLEFDAVKEKITELALNLMRSRVVKLKGGVTLIDDSYNSNPRAIEMVLDYVQQLKGFARKIIVSGDMLELGTISESAHSALGELIAKSNIALLLGVGKLSKLTVSAAINSGMNAQCALPFPDSESVGNYLPPLLKSGDLVLVKGSRGIHTDKVVEAIENYFT